MVGEAQFVDDPHIARIAEALWSREPYGTAALLVGAGFSRNAVPRGPGAGTMPGWNDIYTTMIHQLYPASESAGKDADNRTWLLGLTGATSAYLRVAEEFEAQFGRDALDKLILRHVPDNEFTPGKLHRMLVELPWADILTTNWDTLLERAAEKAEERVYEVLRTVEEIPEAHAPRIVKLHGSFPSHRPFIFTEEDFRTYPARAGAFVNLAQQLAMEKTLVLLGFSGDDPNFLFWSGWVRDRLGPRAPLIYLVGVLDLTPAKRKMLESRHIQPIDLAALPMIGKWPASRQIESANQWFLERLRAAEPYPSRRWPRPIAGFVPPLELVSAAPDPLAPKAAPAIGGNQPPIEVVRELVQHWAQLRSVYPGWVVPPFDAAERIWASIDQNLHEIVVGLRAMEEQERLTALFELNWQQECALAPLDLTVDDIVSELLSSMAAKYSSLSQQMAGQFRALVLALIRHAREVRDSALFEQWSDWLDGRVMDDSEARDRLIYERCLKLRADLDVDRLEALVRSWMVESDTFWNVRKAALLSELGLNKEASEISGTALAAIREQTSRNAKDIASWSRESFAMLVRSSDLNANFGRWLETKPVRDRFDLRQEELHARGCPGKKDFFELVQRLAQEPPPFKKPFEVTSRFDMGSKYKTHHMGRIDHRERRLVAFQALRFVEEAGLPIRISSSGFALQIYSDAARWLIDVAPGRALDAFIIAAPSVSNKQIDGFLTRSAVAKVEAHEADSQLERAMSLIAAAKARIERNGDDRNHWVECLKAILEVASRLVLRAPGRARQLTGIALDINGSNLTTGKIGFGSEVRHLVRRSIEAAEPGDRDAIILSLFESDVPVEKPDVYLETPDLASELSADIRVGAPAERWTDIITALLASLIDPLRRKAASNRLHWLLAAKIPSDAQRLQCAEALWHPEFLADGLPGGTVFFPHAFLSLPHPDGVDVLPLVAAQLFTTAPLTDDEMASGEFAFALDRTSLALGKDDLRIQIERLHKFIVDHGPEPRHPEIFRDNRSDLVDCTARAAAALARRGIGIEDLKAPVADLAALENYPFRREPMIPVLVAEGLMDVDTAIGHVRRLLAQSGEDDIVTVGVFADQLVLFGECEARLEKTIWTEFTQSVVVRRLGSLARILRLMGHVMRVAPERIPNSLDDMLSLGLMLILSETDRAAPTTHPEYDPFMVRFYAAFLVTIMQERGRGDAPMHTAWSDAINCDPLPDTRRAREIALRILSDEKGAEEDF
ncbi:SIR2 family protein [Sphingopyxis sp. DBS4]|uniref:SIR2 family NAD-dependent protein deacylase n=1 Tax=Sphingopyxis sp. DBS4 TaxID=2968500 RepID=UPI00214BE4BE|nr:SIR2 family protein [Sphingopyxis sp. DBS4]